MEISDDFSTLAQLTMRAPPRGRCVVESLEIQKIVPNPLFCPKLFDTMAPAKKALSGFLEKTPVVAGRTRVISMEREFSGRLLLLGLSEN